MRAEGGNEAGRGEAREQNWKNWDFSDPDCVTNREREAREKEGGR